MTEYEKEMLKECKQQTETLSAIKVFVMVICGLLSVLVGITFAK